MQPLQNCIGPTIRIGREILCLPYAGFLLLGCFQQSFQYSPIDDISGQDRTVEPDAAACQTRCAGVAGCSFFSFWADRGGCHLSSEAGVLGQMNGVTAGPSSCSTASNL